MFNAQVVDYLTAIGQERRGCRIVLSSPSLPMVTGDNIPYEVLRRTCTVGVLRRLRKHRSSRYQNTLFIWSFSTVEREVNSVNRVLRGNLGNKE
ncbi:hypothetical protein BDQ12DRAFT_672517 [Crucibulum laeve]|uniref:Uncharacterized protein n=1 Tax=Crucibulum laeve TaxID=68775 RepID=A0A5C3MFN4_9AGAR|nr:hypothetical protein BDQ12DRAFT_672517 [Crucibulum laeve]